MQDVTKKQYTFESVTRGRKLTGQHGEYEFIYQVEPEEQDRSLFTLVSLCYDVSKKKLGFVVIVHNLNFNMLRFIPRALI